MSTTTAPAPERPGVEDIFPVRSRISWGAILAGSFVALAVYFVMTLLGSALGFTIAYTTDTPNTDAGAVAYTTAVIVWGTLANVAALFAGGWVASQLSVGETKTEAFVYGVVVWGVVTASMLFLMASGVKTAFSALTGAATAAAQVAPRADTWDEVARREGVSDEEIDKVRSSWRDQVRKFKEAAKNPETRRDMVLKATEASWYALLCTLVSMASCVGGALYGAGPSFRLVSRIDPRQRVNV